MVTLTLDEETFAALREQADAKGLTVEEWLKRQSREGGLDQQVADQSAEPEEAWAERLQTFIGLHHATGHPVDDSRDRIYD